MSRVTITLIDGRVERFPETAEVRFGEGGLLHVTVPDSDRIVTYARGVWLQVSRDAHPQHPQTISLEKSEGPALRAVRQSGA